MSSGLQPIWIAALAIGLALSGLSGCASRTATPSGAVHDAIQREAAQAMQSPKASTKLDTQAIEQALLPPLEDDSVAGKAKEARFDLVVHNAPATQVFSAIVSGTPFSMLIGPDVTGNITLNLKNVSVRDALDTIRDLYGYEYRVQNDRIFIEPNTVKSQVFKVNYLASKRVGGSNMSVASGVKASANPSAPPTPASMPSPSSGGESLTLNTTTDSNFWDDLRRDIESLVGATQSTPPQPLAGSIATTSPRASSVTSGNTVVLNKAAGLVIVRATPKELRIVADYLRRTQVSVERQVMLEAKIIDVRLNEEYQAGVNWGQFGRQNNRYAIGSTNPGAQISAITDTANIPSQTPSTAIPAAASTLSALTDMRGSALRDGTNIVIAGAKTGMSLASSAGRGFYGLAFQSATFAALLNFLESQGNVSVLSSPRIATLNNQKAVLKVGKDEYYVTNVTVNSGSNGTVGTLTSPVEPTLTPTFSALFSGIALDVTPQIDDDDNIVLHVHTLVSNVTEPVKAMALGYSQPIQIPIASGAVNETDSIVRVKDGNIVAIGGLMKQIQSNDRSGLPGGEGFSLLFGKRDSSLSKQELVILIKPTVIRDEADWQASQREALDRLKEFAPRQPVIIHQ